MNSTELVRCLEALGLLDFYVLRTKHTATESRGFTLRARAIQNRDELDNKVDDKLVGKDKRSLEDKVRENVEK